MPALQPPPAAPSSSSPGRERGDAAASSAGGRRRSRSPHRPRARAPFRSRSPPSSSSSEDERENCMAQTGTVWMELGFPNSGPRGVTEITYLLRSHELKISELESKEQIYCNSLVQLEERIASLEDYKEKLLRRVSRTEEANVTLRSDNSKLKNLAYHLKERVDKLEKDNFMLELKMIESAREMERFQMQVGSTITQMQDNLDRVKALESKERHNTFRQQKLEDSITHHEERITTLEHDISQCTQHVQSLQVKVKSTTSQLQTNNDDHHLLENRIQVLESRERHNSSRLVQMDNSIMHRHERIIGVEQDISSNITQHGQQIQTLQNKENDVLMKSFQSLLTCMVPFIVAFLLSMLSSQSDFGEYEKDLVIHISLVCGLPGVTAMVFAHLASGSFWTFVVSSLTLYFVIYSITLVHYAFIRLLPWSPWTRLQFCAAVGLVAIFLIVVFTMLIVWGIFVKKSKFTRWIASYFSCCPGPA